MSSFVSALLVGCAVIFAANGAQGAPLQQDTYFSGNAANEWDNARDAGRLAREYARHEIEAAGDAVRWRFAPRETTFADIFLRRPIERPFTEMALRVRNAGAPLELTVKLVDAGGAEYTVPAQPLSGAGEWQEVRFPWEQFKVASWSKDTDGRFDWPAGSLAVIAYGIKQGAEYDVNIAAVTLRREPPVHLAVRAAALPAVVAAGGTLTVRGEITPAQDYRSDEANEVQLLRGDQVVARAALPQPVDWKAGQRVAFGPVRLSVPRFTWSGEHTVRLRLGFAAVDCAGGEGVLGRVRVQGRRPGKSVAMVRPYHGVPTLFLNGKPDAAMSYMTYHPNGKYFGQFGQAGIHLYTFSATPTEAAYNLARETWTAPDRFDYSQTDERSLLVLSHDPDGYFFPRLYLRAPKWWTEAHPDELVTYDPGDGKPVLFHHSGGMPVPSWASEVWRRDTAEALRRYIRHMEESPWADRVVGYHIASGTTEEWMMWGGNENQWVDYSRPNREAFHRWLRAKYVTDDALRRAWGDPTVTFDTAAIPTRAQRADAAVFTLHDPATEQQVIDYTLYNSDLVADTIAYFAKVVKEATRREKLVGAFYGYVLQLAAEQRQQNAGHLALDKVLSCPDIDFLTSPTSYAFRTPGVGYSHFMSLTDSVRAHGKLWMDENDIRTWLTGGPTGVWGKTDTYEESLQQQQREFANVLGHGCGKWWFDMGGGWYDDPRLMKDIGGMAAIARQSLAWDRSPVDQIALVLDPRSLAYLRTGNALSGPLIMQQLLQLGHLGAPFGAYMLDDLERIPPHRLYIFVSCFAPTAAQRQMIDRVVKHDGRVAVWIYAPGIARDGRLDTAGMEALTGIHLQWAREEAPLQVQAAGTDALLAGLPADLSYGTAQPTGPLVYADDPKAQVLGRLADGARAGLVVRRFPEWTSVFSAAPALPSSLLRNLARAAGVHLYTDGDEVVYANQSVLAVNVNTGGAHTVHLPRPAKVTELFSGKVIGTGIREFTAEIPAKGTALYHLE